MASDIARSVIDLDRVFTFFEIGFVILILAAIIKTIYNIFFHPLAKFPGPVLPGATRLWHTKNSITGRLPFAIRELHEKYGSVVRIAPNELSYISALGTKDIYGHRTGKEEMEKNAKFYQNINSGPNSIIRASRDRHGVIRRQLAHGFSDKALKEQEHEIQHYAGIAISRLQDICEAGEPANLVAWYNYFTFDLIGDLAFGEPFGCLQNSAYHPWVGSMFRTFKLGARLAALQYYPSMIQQFLRKIVLKSMVAGRMRNKALSRAKATRRMESKSERIDFLTRMVTADTATTTEELMDTAETLIIAGSETTATLLSGLTYYLLMNTDKLDKLVEEIRSAFKTEEEINLVNTSQLPYLRACLEEGLRMYPPVPGNFPRDVPPGGDTIDGQFVPEKAVVSFSQFACYHSKTNFERPDEFLPERWMGDPRFASDNKEAMQPFLLGPRACLGRNLAYVEMKIMLSRLLWNFEIELDDSCKGIWDKQCVYLLWEKSPLLVHLKPAGRAR